MTKSKNLLLAVMTLVIITFATPSPSAQADGLFADMVTAMAERFHSMVEAKFGPKIAELEARVKHLQECKDKAEATLATLDELWGESDNLFLTPSTVPVGYLAPSVFLAGLIALLLTLAARRLAKPIRFVLGIASFMGVLFYLSQPLRATQVRHEMAPHLAAYETTCPDLPNIEAAASMDVPDQDIGLKEITIDFAKKVFTTSKVFVEHSTRKYREAAKKKAEEALDNYTPPEIKALEEGLDAVSEVASKPAEIASEWGLMVSSRLGWVLAPDPTVIKTAGWLSLLGFALLFLIELGWWKDFLLVFQTDKGLLLDFLRGKTAASDLTVAPAGHGPQPNTPPTPGGARANPNTNRQVVAPQATRHVETEVDDPFALPDPTWDEPPDDY